MLDADDAGSAYGCLQGELVDGGPGREKVKRRVHRRADVRPHGEVGDIIAVTPIHILDPANFHARVAGPVDHAGSQRDRDVNPIRIHWWSPEKSSPANLSI